MLLDVLFCLYKCVSSYYFTAWYVLLIEGSSWPNRYSTTCSTTNVYKLDVYAGSHGFDPELRQYASRVPSPCGLTVVYKISPPLNLAGRDIACTKWN